MPTAPDLSASEWEARGEEAEGEAGEDSGDEEEAEDAAAAGRTVSDPAPKGAADLGTAATNKTVSSKWASCLSLGGTPRGTARPRPPRRAGSIRLAGP